MEALKNLVRIGQLKEEKPDPDEFEGLVHSGTVRAHDARLEALNLESRFDLLYNAAHSLALAALRWHGYRSENRYLVFQCLQHTLDLPAEEWRILDTAHRKRNLAEYEGHLDVTTGLLKSLAEVVDTLETRIHRLGLPTSKGS